MSETRKILAFECKVIERTYVTPTVFHLKFETQPEFIFKGGQFLSLVVPGRGPQGRDLRRAYSVASSPEDRPVVLCVKLVEGGPGTGYLNSLNPGDVFKANGPYGDFVFKTAPDRHACFLATGTGVAPFRSIVGSDSYRNQPPLSATCLFGVRGEEEVLYRDFFVSAARASSKFKWVECLTGTGDSWQGFRGRLTEYLQKFERDFDWEKTDFYMCGNGAMITEAKSYLLSKHVPKESIFQEVYYRPVVAPVSPDPSAGN